MSAAPSRTDCSTGHRRVSDTYSTPREALGLVRVQFEQAHAPGQPRRFIVSSSSDGYVRVPTNTCGYPTKGA